MTIYEAMGYMVQSPDNVVSCRSANGPWWFRLVNGNLQRKMYRCAWYDSAFNDKEKELEFKACEEDECPAISSS